MEERRFVAERRGGVGENTKLNGENESNQAKD